MATDRVMLDLETMGLEPGVAIVSIGAVRFGPAAGGLGQEFYREVSLESCQAAGLEIDAGTVEWWLGQGNTVRQAVVGGDGLSDVLSAFDSYYADADELWAFSPAFDCAILAAAYGAVLVPDEAPWSYRDERDCRTLASLPAWPDSKHEGRRHHALDDAKHQARETLAALDRLGALEDGDDDE